jgi:hypothetical protein
MSASDGSIFGRVLVGIDESPESPEAARQAATLATGSLTLLAAYDLNRRSSGAAWRRRPSPLSTRAGSRERRGGARACEAGNRRGRASRQDRPRTLLGGAPRRDRPRARHARRRRLLRRGPCQGHRDRLDGDRARPQGPVLGAGGAEAAEGLPGPDRGRSRRLEGGGRRGRRCRSARQAVSGRASSGSRTCPTR